MKKEKNLKFKKFGKIIIIVIFLLILSLITFHFINNFISKKQIESFRKNIEEISSNEISYVIIEINPKVLIELTGDKVTNKICLNSDCESAFKSLDLKNKELKETITILYDTAKIKGIDVSNGVKLSTTNIKLQEFIEDLDYVTYNIITADEESDILENLENKEDIKEKKNEYNKKLINIYKEDSDYGKYYTCKEENNTIKCYITSDFEKDLSEIFNITNLNTIINNARNLNRVLDKFNVQYNYQDSFGVKDIYEIKANGTYLTYGHDLDYGVSDANGNSNNIHYNFPYLEIDNHFLGIENQLLPLIKLNLVDSTYDTNDLIMLGNEYNNNNNDNDNDNVIKYTISFDTNGGNTIDSQEVVKDEKIIKPSNPTRKGYKFIEWQLDSKTFDFDTVITKNITLKAIWEKEVTQSNNSSNNNNNHNNNNNNNNNANNANNNKKCRLDDFSINSGNTGYPFNYADYGLHSNLEEAVARGEGITYIMCPGITVENAGIYGDYETVNTTVFGYSQELLLNNCINYKKSIGYQVDDNCNVTIPSVCYELENTFCENGFSYTMIDGVKTICFTTCP